MEWGLAHVLPGLRQRLNRLKCGSSRTQVFDSGESGGCLPGERDLPNERQVEMDSMHFHLEAEDLEIFEEWRPSSTNEEDGELLSEDDVLDSQAGQIGAEKGQFSGLRKSFFQESQDVSPIQ